MLRSVRQNFWVARRWWSGVVSFADVVCWHRRRRAVHAADLSGGDACGHSHLLLGSSGLKLLVSSPRLVAASYSHSGNRLQQGGVSTANIRLAFCGVVHEPLGNSGLASGQRDRALATRSARDAGARGHSGGFVR